MRPLAISFLCLLFASAAPLKTFAEAHDQLEKGKYVDVLEYALEALKQDPDSFETLFLLGAALHRGEGNLPLAQRRLEQAQKIVARRGGYNSLSTDAQKIYVDTLSELIWIYGESEQYNEELNLIDSARSETGLDWGFRGGWAMMKLGRLDEARTLMASYAHNSDAGVRATAMNTLGAIESAAGNLEDGYNWFTKIMQDEDAKKAFGGATLYSNRSEAAASLLWFGREESDLLEAVKHFSTGSYSNPWSNLTFLYIGEGKLPQAVDAARRMREWDRSSDAEIEQHRWNLDTRLRAILMLAAGHDRAALDALEMVLRRPDRQGTTSSDPVEAEICLLAVFDEALRVNRERALELLTWRRPAGWFPILRDVVTFSIRDWTTRSRLRALVIKNDKLAWVLRPYAQDSVIPEWIRPAIVAALGEKIAANKLRELLQSAPERERPYLRETLGEIEAKSGHYRNAIDTLQAALRDLPQEEPLVRARANAMLADALHRSGETEAARAHYLKAFELDARVFRSLSLSIPATIHDGGDTAGAQAAKYLSASPRFRVGAIFTIDIHHTAQGLEATLEDSTGTVLSRAKGQTPNLLADETNDKFFSPHAMLSGL